MQLHSKLYKTRQNTIVFIPKVKEIKSLLYFMNKLSDQLLSPMYNKQVTPDKLQDILD